MKLIKSFFEHYPLRLWLMILCAVIVQLILFFQKNVFHGDEFVTFNMMSGHYGEYMNMQDVVLPREYLIYVFNNADARFLDMWQDLYLDVHLPFYFIALWPIKLLVNTNINFMLPAEILNVLALIGLLIGFYKLCLELFKNKEIALASVFLFMFSAHMISFEILLRMYLLWIFLAVWQLYFTIHFIKGQTDKKTLCLIGLFSTLQILTHYYGFVFSFILTGITLFVLLFDEKFVKKKLILFALVMLISALMVFIIFPEMVDVILHRHRGPDTFRTLKDWAKYPLDVFSWRAQFLDEILPVSLEVIIVFVLFLNIAFMYLFKHKKITSEDGNIFLILTFLFLLYSLVIMVIMPDVSDWHDNSFRYFSLSYPIGFLLLTYFVVICGQILKLKDCLVALILLVIAGGHGIMSASLDDKAVYFQFSGDRDKLMRALKNHEVWYNFSAGDMIHILDGLYFADDIYILSDYESENFAEFAQQGKMQNKYAYLLMPIDFESSIPNIVDWIRNTLGRKVYYLYTLKNNPKMAVSLDMIVLMVAPY